MRPMLLGRLVVQRFEVLCSLRPCRSCLLLLCLLDLIIMVLKHLREQVRRYIGMYCVLV